MKVELRIDPSLRRTQVVVCAPANTPEVQALVQRLSTEGAASTFTAFREGQALLLPLGDILRFFAYLGAETSPLERRLDRSNPFRLPEAGPPGAG